VPPRCWALFCSLFYVWVLRWFRYCPPSGLPLGYVVPRYTTPVPGFPDTLYLLQLLRLRSRCSQHTRFGSFWILHTHLPYGSGEFTYIYRLRFWFRCHGFWTTVTFTFGAFVRYVTCLYRAFATHARAFTFRVATRLVTTPPAFPQFPWFTPAPLPHHTLPTQLHWFWLPHTWILPPPTTPLDTRLTATTPHTVLGYGLRWLRLRSYGYAVIPLFPPPAVLPFGLPTRFTVTAPHTTCPTTTPQFCPGYGRLRLRYPYVTHRCLGVVFTLFWVNILVV